MDDNYVEFMKEMLDAQGVACSTVKDGHVLMFKRSMLESMLNANPDKEQFVVFVKRPDLHN